MKPGLEHRLILAAHDASDPDVQALFDGVRELGDDDLAETLLRVAYWHPDIYEMARS